MRLGEFVFAAALALIVIVVGGMVIAAQDRPCFEIVNFEKASGRPSQFLLNKCTGENWISLTQDVSKEEGMKSDSVRWGWYRMPIFDGDNAVSGKQ